MWRDLGLCSNTGRNVQKVLLNRGREDTMVSILSFFAGEGFGKKRSELHDFTWTAQTTTFTDRAYNHFRAVDLSGGGHGTIKMFH